MRRRAADNEYLHKDFHLALNCALEYLRERYGDDAVRDYLRQFARAFYAPLNRALRANDLQALRRHFERIYHIEDGDVRIDPGPGELVLWVEACPAVTHIRARGHEPSPLFYETARTVNETICEGTPFGAELVLYDEATGRSCQRFFRRATA